ncbi:MAG: hypothetical protein ABI878_02500 [Acidobacteriota bacterium]
MVNRMRANVAVEIDKLNERDRTAVLAHASEVHRTQRSHKENTIGDELIGSLANAHENLRARQVTEWEQMRRQLLGRAA